MEIDVFKPTNGEKELSDRKSKEKGLLGKKRGRLGLERTKKWIKTAEKSVNSPGGKKGKGKMFKQAKRNEREKENSSSGNDTQRKFI